jgi:predicted RNase H-like HicB family nuclease
MAKITFHATIHEEDDGTYWAEVKELPGCFASGHELPELEEALVEAIQLCLPEGLVMENPVVGPDDPHGRPGKAGAQRHLLVSA